MNETLAPAPAGSLSPTDLVGARGRIEGSGRPGVHDRPGERGAVVRGERRMRIAETGARGGFRPQRLLDRDAGMTLLEVMFAAIILAVIVLGIFSAIFTSMETTEFAKESEVAQFDLERVMEDILSEAFDSTTVVYPQNKVLVKGGYVTRVNGQQRQYNDLILKGEQITITYPSTLADPLEIRLALAWTNRDGRSQTLQLASMKTR
jgi:type II secretory pathway pseudopilin PulG